MKILSDKLVELHPKDGYASDRIAHWCPACGELHPFAVKEKQRNGAQWTFNGDLLRPTFSPSMNITIGPWPADAGPGLSGKTERCHYFLRDGMIEYLSDCTHEFAGRQVKLPDLPESVHIRVRANA